MHLTNESTITIFIYLNLLHDQLVRMPLGLLQDLLNHHYFHCLTFDYKRKYIYYIYIFFIQLAINY